MKIIIRMYIQVIITSCIILGNNSISNATSLQEARSLSNLPSPTSERKTNEKSVVITGLWIKLIPPSEGVSTGYMTIMNTSNKEVRIINFESEGFTDIDIYEMVRRDELLEMIEQSEIDIPVNGQIQFAPGGKHLMLMRARENIVKKQKVDIILTFKSGKKQTVSFTALVR